MSGSKFLVFKTISQTPVEEFEEVAINVGLIRVIKHRPAQRERESILEVYFIDEVEPTRFYVTEGIAMSVILKLQEMRP
jgi:hypothetical protein